MTHEEKLDYIIKKLDQLCNVTDPYPGYVQRSDGRWRNRITGEDMCDKMQREARAAAKE